MSHICMSSLISTSLKNADNYNHAKERRIVINHSCLLCTLLSQESFSIYVPREGMQSKVLHIIAVERRRIPYIAWLSLELNRQW